MGEGSETNIIIESSVQMKCFFFLSQYYIFSAFPFAIFLNFALVFFLLFLNMY